MIAGSKVKFIQHTHYTLSAHLDHSSNLHKKYSERNSWIFSVTLEKTSNLSRNIGNENANAMCEGEGEIPICWKSNDRWRKESVEHYMMHFSYIFGQYPTLYTTIMKKFSTSWDFPWNCKTQALRVIVNSSSQIKYWEFASKQ